MTGEVLAKIALFRMIHPRRLAGGYTTPARLRCVRDRGTPSGHFFGAGTPVFTGAAGVFAWIPSIFKSSK